MEAYKITTFFCIGSPKGVKSHVFADELVKKHFDKADINKDNVIDKNESIEFYKKNNSIDYHSPFYIFSILAGGVLFICFWPLVISYTSLAIKHFKKSS